MGWESLAASLAFRAQMREVMTFEFRWVIASESLSELVLLILLDPHTGPCGLPLYATFSTSQFFV